jgi:hypothetical protein
MDGSSVDCHEVVSDIPRCKGHAIHQAIEWSCDFRNPLTGNKYMLTSYANNAALLGSYRPLAVCGIPAK